MRRSQRVRGVDESSGARSEIGEREHRRVFGVGDVEGRRILERRGATSATAVGKCCTLSVRHTIAWVNPHVRASSRKRTKAKVRRAAMTLGVGVPMSRPSPGISSSLPQQCVTFWLPQAHHPPSRELVPLRPLAVPPLLRTQAATQRSAPQSPQNRHWDDSGRVRVTVWRPVEGLTVVGGRCKGHGHDQ
jgi:hypothetical protein